MAITIEGFKEALNTVIEREDDMDVYDSLGLGNLSGYWTKPYEVKAEVVTVEFVQETDLNWNKDFSYPEDVEQVFRVTSSSGVQYFKRTGTHQSYAGTEWNDWQEVKPVEKKVIAYE